MSSFAGNVILNNLKRYNYDIRNLCKIRCNLVNSKACFATKGSKSDDDIPKNEVEPFITAHLQKDFGVIYDRKPFKVRLYPNKVYHWCLCGQSKTQPFCDGTHKYPYLKIKLRPVRLEVKEEKDYWLCNCKQTSNRPFCDGTHKREDIQEKFAERKQQQ